MKAMVYKKYGPPEVLKVEEVTKPVPKSNEVLIKVIAATVTATDCTFRKGKPFFSRLYTGITKPKHQILGSEFTGEIIRVGKNVKSFQVGNKVIGTTPGYGAYTEFICQQEEGSTLAKLPSDINYEEAIACCDGFLTALPFLRAKGEIKKGDKVLINGASGSVGSAAVQLSKYFGAEVTGVCSSSSIELVKSIGADKVIDYTKESLTNSDDRFDIIFDVVGNTTFSMCKKLLNKNGKYLQAGITLSVFPSVIWTSLIGSKKALIMATGLRPPVERSKDLIFIGELLQADKIKAIIDKIYSFDQMVEAHHYVDGGHKKGNVVIQISDF
ncbi:MAG: NAD(P)-dependent alcohol dehydrogenase [Ignavibacteriales bacterium]|nr:NAD(P)-dependent alcohol dehydrogenase [Ignavibacteriales bacterium]